MIYGEKKEVSYLTLDQIRLIRNALIHKGGELTEDWEKITLMSKPDDNRIVVSDTFLWEIELILKSITHNLYRLASNSKIDF